MAGDRHPKQRARALSGRYAALMSRFLTARLYSAETVDVNQFLDTVADDLMNKPGTRRTGPGGRGFSGNS